MFLWKSFHIPMQKRGERKVEEFEIEHIYRSFSSDTVAANGLNGAGCLQEATLNSAYARHQLRGTGSPLPAHFFIYFFAARLQRVLPGAQYVLHATILHQRKKDCLREKTLLSTAVLCRGCRMGPTAFCHKCHVVA